VTFEAAREATEMSHAGRLVIHLVTNGAWGFLAGGRPPRLRSLPWMKAS